MCDWIVQIYPEKNVNWNWNYNQNKTIIDLSMLQNNPIMYTVERLMLCLPGQRYIQHHGEKSPSHICHLGQTTVDHTWGPHEEPLERDQSFLYYRGSQLKVTVPHANRIFLIQPGRNNIKLEAKWSKQHFLICLLCQSNESCSTTKHHKVRWRQIISLN